MPEKTTAVVRREIEDRFINEWGLLANAWGVSPLLGRIHGLLLLVGIVAALIVLMAYGLALLLGFVIPFPQFDLAILSLLALIPTLWFALRLIQVLVGGPLIEEVDDVDDFADDERESSRPPFSRRRAWERSPRRRRRRG